MKKILFATKDPSDTTSFLRAWGAFTERSLRDIVTPTRCPEKLDWVMDWSRFFEHDIIFMHRPSSTYDGHVVEMAKQHGIPLWVDLDDDLQNVPESNRVFHTYHNKTAQDVIEASIVEADVLSCGGETHKARLEKQYNREVILIPNAVDDRLCSFKKPWKNNNRICWRGSDSHQIDLVTFQKPILELIKEYPDWQWFFFGRYPLILKHEQYPNIKWGPETNLMDFYTALVQFNAEIQIVPLMDSAFNRVKSNLSWSDATLAGSVAVVPDFEEFQRPGCFTYKNIDDFYNRTKELIQRRTDGDQWNKQAWEWIKGNIMLSQVNKIRIDIINNL